MIFERREVTIDTKRRIAVICGSLRTDSYNRKLLETIEQVALDRWETEEIDLSEVPFFSEDIESSGEPPSVGALQAGFSRADGILIVTPEYNGGMPATVKNAIDWASRASNPSLLAKKPFAVAGATSGTAGTIQSQLQVKHVLTHVGAYVMPSPKILVNSADTLWTEGSTVIQDEATHLRLQHFAKAFDEWIERVSP
ncbi:NADPH-dependent FMN reductase [Shouchella shacheensis]|uniref:NADPH-dependent FMN reductase n=1 Tax=Shouchella shacheensis TaxID=1649580 RepID=UPI0007400B2E|nr:NAD(P)H-dependent oxidoreductase [Shouchella shacheensis]